MSDEREEQLAGLQSERALTIDRATALARLGAIYAFGIPDLRSHPGRSGAGPAPGGRNGDDPASAG